MIHTHSNMQTNPIIPVWVEEVIVHLKEVIICSIHPLNDKYLKQNNDIYYNHPVKPISQSVRGVSYRRHLIVELRQGGVRAQICGVFLKELQLFVKPVLIFFTAIPASTHWAVQSLTSMAPPLKDHHLFRGLDMADMTQHTHRLDLATHSAPCTYLRWMMHVLLSLTWGESTAWLWSRAWHRGCWWCW